MLLKALKRFLVKEVVNTIDISKPMPVAKVTGKGSSKPKARQKTVISDVINNPEAFILEAWIEKDEINVRVKRRCIETDGEVKDKTTTVGYSEVGE